MSIMLRCECGETLEVADSLKGQQAKCPKCSKSLVIDDTSVLGGMRDGTTRSKLTAQDLYERVKESVVAITHDDVLGTGFFVGSLGMVVTTHHPPAPVKATVLVTHGHVSV